MSTVQRVTGGTSSADGGDDPPGRSAVGERDRTPVDFADFLRINLPALMRYGVALTGNPHDGADLVQTACEKAALHWHRIGANESTLAYVKASMANARVSFWRKRRRESLLAVLPETAVHDGYPAEAGGVWTAVSALPRKQRAVIVLRYVEGHSEQEIADILKISVGTVKSHSSRAIAALRRDAHTDFSTLNGRGA